MLPDALGFLFYVGKLLVNLLLSFSNSCLRLTVNAIRFRFIKLPLTLGFLVRRHYPVFQFLVVKHHRNEQSKTNDGYDGKKNCHNVESVCATGPADGFNPAIQIFNSSRIFWILARRFSKFMSSAEECTISAGVSGVMA